MSDFDNFLYNCLVTGYKIMGVNHKKIDRMVLFRESVKRYREFIKKMDVNPIVDYFELGLEARDFKDGMTGRILEKNDDIFWGFNHKGYQYTLRRQPLKISGNDMQSIANELFQGIKNEGISRE